MRGHNTQFRLHDRIAYAETVQPDQTTVIGFDYDLDGNLESITLPGPITHSFGYDDLNRNTTYTSPLNRTYTYVYDDDHRMTQVTLPSTAAIQYNYALGRLTSIVTPDGTTSITYDAAGRAVTVSRGSESATFGYDGGLNITSADNYDVAGRLVSSIDPKGHAWTYTYTLYDQLARSTAPAPGNGSSASPSTAYIYDPNNNIDTISVAHFDENGGVKPPIVTKYVYDNMERVERIIRDANGLAATTAYEYDMNGRVTKQLTPEAVAGTQPDNHTSYVYDERDLLFQSIAAGVETTQYDYDAWGNLLLQTFHDATTAGHTYDVYGREASMTSRDGTVTTVVARNKRGLVEQEDVIGAGPVTLAQTWTQYDEMGRVTKVKVNSDTVGTRFTYAPAGQLWKTEDPENHIATTAFDIMHRVAATKDGQGNVASYEYDANSNVTVVHQVDYDEAASGTVTLPDITYGYDNLDRRIAVEDIAGNVTLSKFDSLSRLRWTQDPEGNTTRYTYDNLGRQIAMARYGAGGSTPIATTSQAFDLNGRLVRRTDPKNFSTAYHFDALDRRFKITYADGSMETVLEFDDLRRPQQVRNQDGSLVTYGYDAEGRVTSRTTTAPSGILATTESFNYDGLGRVTSQAVTGTADSIATSTSFTYNDAANPPTVTKTIAVGSHTRTTTTSYLHTGQPVGTQREGGRALGYGYNGAGRLSGITMNGSPLADIDYVGGRRAEHTVGGEVKAAYGYTPSSSGYRVAGTTHTDVGTSAVLDARTNAWDGNYNRTGRSITGGPAALQANHVYTYDGLNRMTTSAKGAATLSYTLDAAGNRTQTSDGTTTETYGFFGTGQRLHQYSTSPQGDFGYDGAGRLNALLGPGNSYVYDAMGRLKELRLGAGAALESMETSLPAQSVQDSGVWSVANGYLEETSAGAGRIRWPMDAELRKFTFLYWSGHDPADPDGDADTDPDHFDPEYYAQVILRASQYPVGGPDELEWKFLALVIQPDGIYLREWDKDEVTELGGAAVAIPKEQWHAVTIELSGADGETVTVKQALHNASETQSIEATTAITEGEYIGFGVGEKANFRFDDVGTDKPVAASVAPTTTPSSRARGATASPLRLSPRATVAAA